MANPPLILLHGGPGYSETHFFRSFTLPLEKAFTLVYWDELSAVPEAEQCGWLKNRYGVSWQIVPSAMDEMMRSGTSEQIARVTQAFLPMKKLDIAELQRAYEGA